MKPKIIILISLSVVIILTLAISFSYAIWISNNQQTGENVVKSGCLEITYEEDANSVISIENGYPISDEAGLETIPYTFKIKNTCTINTEYNVNAEVLDNTTLAHDFLRIMLDDEQSNIINSNQLIEETIENAISYNLNTYYLEPEEERTHSFRMWIDKDTTTTDGNNKLINLSITITAVVDKFVPFTQEFAYTGDSQEFIVPETGYYQIELWGAQGGNITNTSLGGSASYTTGIIELEKNQELYFYIGENPGTNEYLDNPFNGGGLSNLGHSHEAYVYAGGGATDIRIELSDWNNTSSLKSRIMIAAGGGGSAIYHLNYPGGDAGGLIGYNGYYVNYPTDGNYYYSTNSNANQINGGGTVNENYAYTIYGGTGGFGIGGSSAGSGYYGGAHYYSNSRLYSGFGGSSFISGHTGAVAITSETDQTPKAGCTTGTTDNACSNHYSGYVFTDTVMIDGAGYSWTNVKSELEQMPNPSGGYYELGVGHNGNGYARITRVR